MYFDGNRGSFGSNANFSPHPPKLMKWLKLKIHSSKTSQRLISENRSFTDNFSKVNL